MQCRCAYRQPPKFLPTKASCCAPISPVNHCCFRPSSPCFGLSTPRACDVAVAECGALWTSRRLSLPFAYAASLPRRRLPASVPFLTLPRRLLSDCNFINFLSSDFILHQPNELCSPRSLLGRLLRAVAILERNSYLGTYYRIGVNCHSVARVNRCTSPGSTLRATVALEIK